MSYIKLSNNIKPYNNNPIMLSLASKKESLNKSSDILLAKVYPKKFTGAVIYDDHNSNKNVMLIQDIDFSSVQYYGFQGCDNLITVGKFNLSPNNPDSLSNYFASCSKLIAIPQIDTSNVLYFDSMFDWCWSLPKLPALDLTNGISFSRMFCMCRSLVTIEKLIIGNGKKTYDIVYPLPDYPEITMEIGMEDMFSGCGALENIIIEGTIKVNSNNLDLSDSTKLTVDSIMSFINSFEDNTGEEIQYTVTFGATNLAKLAPEQIAVATNKNILLA